MTMPQTANRLAVICTAEPLGVRSVKKDDTLSSLRLFGLTLSAAIRGETALADREMNLLRSWDWMIETIHVREWNPATQKTVAGPFRAVRLVPDLPSSADQTKLKAAMDLRWQQAKAQSDRFRWKDDPYKELEGESRPWHVELANASAFPYPYAQYLQLSFIFPYEPANAYIIAAPEIVTAGLRYVPVQDPAGGVTPHTDGTPLWEYEVRSVATGALVSDAVPATAWGPAVFRDRKKEGWVEDTLWISLPADRRASGLSGEDWRSRLPRRAAELADVSHQLVEAAWRNLRSDSGTRLDRTHVPALRRMFLAALHDVVGYGAWKGPDGVSLLDRWRSELRLRNPVPTDAVKTLDQLIAAKPPSPPMLEAWSKEVAKLAPVGAPAWAAAPGEDPPEAADAVAEMQSVRDALKVDENAVQVVIERWKEVLKTEAGALDVLEREIRATPAALHETSERLMLGLLGAEAGGNTLWRELTLLKDAGPEELERQLASASQRIFRRRLGDGAASPPLDAVLALLGPPAPAAPDVLAMLVAHADANLAEQAGVAAGKRPVGQKPGSAPHPLVIQVSELTREGAVQDREDPLRSVAGVGVLLRKQDGEWRALNRARAAQLTEKVRGRPDAPNEWDQSLLVPLRASYREGVTAPMAVYNNAPLTGLSYDARLANHTLQPQAGGSDEEPAFRYAQDSRAILPALAFKRSYDVAVFAIANSGALPAGIADPTHPARLSATLTVPDAVPRKGIPYRRRVGVGQPRLLCDGPFPPVPDRVVPRAGELARDDERLRAAPLILMAGGTGNELRDVGRKSSQPFVFRVRPPATDIQTWLRWRFDDRPPGMQEVIATYYDNLGKNHAAGGETNRSTCASDRAWAPVDVDDPAVSHLRFQLLRFRDGQPQTVNEHDVRVVEKPSRPDVPGIPGASSPPVTVQVAIGNSADLKPSPTGGVLVTVQQGELYQLRIVSLISTADWDARMDAETAWETEVRGSYRLVSALPLWIEVATPEPLGTPQALAEVLQPRFDPEEQTLSVELRPGGAGARLISRVDLLRQRWVWDGRPVEVEKIPGVASGTWPNDWWHHVANEAKLTEWEAIAFGARDHTDHYAEGMDPRVARGARIWNRTLPLASEPGAQYYRFAVVAHHRYQGFYNNDLQVRSARPAKDAAGHYLWNGYMVPCRLRAPLGPPPVRVVLPLVDVVTAGSGGGGGQPGLLLVSAESAFAHAGLAERAAVKILTASDAQHSPEVAPDPTVSASEGPLQPAPFVPIGPVGHTFDSEGGLRHWNSASYVLPWPQFEAKHAEAPWYFVKLRFGRRIERTLLVDGGGRVPEEGASPAWMGGEVDEKEGWTRGGWSQVVPNFSVFSGDRVPVDQLRLRRGGVNLSLVGNNGVTELKAVPGPFRLFLLVTEQVRDVSGRANAETYVGIYGQRGQEWVPLPSGATERIGVDTGVVATGQHLVARVLEVQLGSNFAPSAALATEAEFWRALFPAATDRSSGGATAERGRARIVRLSRAITEGSGT